MRSARVWLLRAAQLWKHLATGSGLHQRVVPDAVCSGAGDCTHAMWQAWWLHCGTLGVTGSDVIRALEGMQSGNSCITTSAQHHQPMRAYV